MLLSVLPDPLLKLLISPAVLKIVYFLALWLALWLPVAVPLALRLNWRPFQASSPAQKLPLLLGLYLMVPVALAIIGWGSNWKQLLSAYGLAWQPGLWVSLMIGLLAGGSSLALLFGGQIKAGWLQRPAANQPAKDRTYLLIYLLLLGLALLVGGIEELVFRGLMQAELQQVLGWWPAAVAVSLLFAGLHGVWEGKSVLPQLPGLGLMGLVLTLARQVDGGELGLAWGLHAGWVWVLASLETLGFTHYSGQAPLWLTGWNNQPLAGLLGLLFLLGTAAGLWWQLRWV